MLFVNVCFCIFVIICVKLGRHGTQDKFQSDLTIKYYLILSYYGNGILVQRAVPGRDGALGGAGPSGRCSPGAGSGR